MNEKEQHIDSIADAALTTIAQKKIAPKPRWHFVARNALLWMIGALFAVCGALFVALVIFILRNELWSEYGALSLSSAQAMRIALAVPSVWALSFIAFLVTAEWVIRHAGRAYRVSVLVMTITLASISVIGGAALYATGVAHYAERFTEAHMPRYQSVDARRNQLFYAPTQGRIRGEVMIVAQDDVVLHNKRLRKQWIVDTEALPPRKRAALHIGDDVIFFGAMRAQGDFVACDSVVLPRRGFMRQWYDAARKGRSDDGSRRHALTTISSSCATIMAPDIYHAMRQHLQNR